MSTLSPEHPPKLPLYALQGLMILPLSGVAILRPVSLFFLRHAGGGGRSCGWAVMPRAASSGTACTWGSPTSRSPAASWPSPWVRIAATCTCHRGWPLKLGDGAHALRPSLLRSSLLLPSWLVSASSRGRSASSPATQSLLKRACASAPVGIDSRSCVANRRAGVQVPHGNACRLPSPMLFSPIACSVSQNADSFTHRLARWGSVRGLQQQPPPRGGGPAAVGGPPLAAARRLWQGAHIAPTCHPTTAFLPALDDIVANVQLDAHVAVLRLVVCQDVVSSRASFASFTDRNGGSIQLTFATPPVLIDAACAARPPGRAKRRAAQRTVLQ